MTNDEYNNKLLKMKYIVTESTKKYGDNKVKFGMDTTERKTTGSIYYDYLLGGGFEPGTITLYYGLTGSGKTTMSLRNIAAAQRRGETCAWLRIEKGCNRAYMERLGVNVDELLIIENLPNGEAYLNILLELVEKEIDMVVVDSISALTPKREMDDPMEKEHPGLQAKLISTMLRKVNGANVSSNIIFISQCRQAFTQGYIKYNFAGGFATQHNTDYIVEFKIKDKLGEDGKEIVSSELKTEDKRDVVGVNMLMYVSKCRRGLAHKAGEMYFNFQTGRIDEIGELIKVATKLEVFSYSGGWMTIGDEFKDKFEFTSNKIRHKELKVIISENESMITYITDRIKEHYEG